MPTYHVPVAKILPLAIVTNNNKVTLECFFGNKFSISGVNGKTNEKGYDVIISLFLVHL
jgi:hypothetical protein